MRIVFLSLGVSLLASIGLVFFYNHFQQDKIGYVKTGIVLQKYAGMQEATRQFNSELAVVQRNIDTLKNRFENLKLQEKNNTVSQKADWGYKLGVAEKEYTQYNETASQQLQQRQQQLTSDVLNKVNSFIQEYGKEQGYRIIFGTTNDGSILYGEEKDDLTNIILEQLNKNYKKTSDLSK